MLNRLANELILNIIESLCPSQVFSTTDPYPNSLPPPLKSLSRCSRRFYTLSFPYLFSSIRLRLHDSHTLNEIANLRQFLTQNHLRVQTIAISFGHYWNSGKVGKELKKFLWEHHIISLSLHQTRGDQSVREKCAKWSYALEHIQSLRLSTIDDDGDLKMLLLRQCPATYVVIEDGNFREVTRTSPIPELLSHHDVRPAIAHTKPALFPNLTKLEYSACWPSLNRVVLLLEFVAKLPALRRFEIALMDGEEVVLKDTDIWFRPTPEGILYRRVISAYARLGTVVDEMDVLEVLEVRDSRVPFHGDTRPPRCFVEFEKGLYRRIDRKCDDLALVGS
ncbi:hypothetical protein BDD12DRAFT_811915 [Trichophaea hybrida]|nr:hypothetical protein BDD12DRAFT_811915 [Trichophaea hybrida]